MVFWDKSEKISSLSVVLSCKPWVLEQVFLLRSFVSYVHAIDENETKTSSWADSSEFRTMNKNFVSQNSFQCLKEGFLITLTQKFGRESILETWHDFFQVKQVAI